MGLPSATRVPREPDWIRAVITHESAAHEAGHDTDVVGCAMRRFLVLAALLVACRRSEPQPRVAPAIGSAGSAAVGSAGSAGFVYRTPASGDHVDPKLAGTGKTSVVAAEDRHAPE